MATFRALSRGSQIVLVAGPLLLFSLFLTWQHLEVDYGRAGVSTITLDGWDAWGLLLSLLVASTVTIVALESLTDELSSDISWPTITFALGGAVLAVAAVKSLTDAGSSWESYGFVALAGGVAVGTFLDWMASRSEPEPVLAQKRRGLRSAA
jgi:hypothetical protein